MACILIWCVPRRLHSCSTRPLIDPSPLTTAFFPIQRSTSCFGNYVDDDQSFDDAASATLLAATTYRLSTLAGKHKHIPLAERTRIALTARSNIGGGPSNGTFESMVHFDVDGWLSPVTNPALFGQSGSKSPEAQAFVLMMQASYQDWARAGYKGANTGIGGATPHLLATSFWVGVSFLYLLYLDN